MIRALLPPPQLTALRHTARRSRSVLAERYALYIQLKCVFEWDKHNLNKIKVHGIKAAEVEQALSISPILIYEQDAEVESRYVYYGETAALRLLAVVLTERNEKIRVITAYELDASQKRDYFERRLREE
jgi:uncharacterized DUF497 family protein